jgi:hypothetical protein
MVSLLEQVEALDFESREKIVVALKKRPEKTKEELVLEEIRALRSAVDKSEKNRYKKTESMFTMFFIAFVCVLIFLLPGSSKLPLRLF